MYAPAIHDAGKGDTAIVVTAVHDGTIVNILDDSIDGDDDDTTLGINLSRGQSYVTYLSGGSINDGPEGKWDGDFFAIDASAPVMVELATTSSFKHDWVPSENGTLSGRSFFLHALETDGPRGDINAFAHEAAHIEILDVTSFALDGGGLSSIDLHAGTPILSLNLAEGEDLYSAHAAGIDVLEPGHTYWVRTSGDVSVMQGAISANNSNNRARHGGSFVPADDGRRAGQRFHFGIPHNKKRDFEKEIHVYAPEDEANIVLEGWDEAALGWSVIDDATLEAGEHFDLIAFQSDLFRDAPRYRLTASADVTLFEASWMFRKWGGKNDIATFIPADDGRNRGQAFTVFATPPGQQDNLDGFDGKGSHLYLTTRGQDAEVWVYDANTGGALFDQVVTVPDGDYAQVTFTDADYNLMAIGEFPYLRAEVISGGDVVAMHSNHRQTFSTFVPPTAASRVGITLDAPDEATCAGSTVLDLMVTPTQALASGQVSVNLPPSLDYLGSSGSLGSPTATAAEGGTTLLWDDVSLASAAEASISVQIDCSSNAFHNGEIASASAAVTSVTGDTTDAAVDAAGMTLNLPDATLLRSLSTIAGDASATVLWSTGPEFDSSGFEVLRAETPNGPFEVVEGSFTASRGNNARGFSHAFVDDTLCNCGPVYYKVREVGGTEVELGPVEVTPSASAVGMTATGNVEADFAGRGLFFADVTGDVPLPAGISQSGSDLAQLGFAYERTTDVLYVGIDAVGIFGDVDGDGDPNGTSSTLDGLGGIDRADFALDETFVLVFDVDGDGVGDSIVGTPFGSALNGVQARIYDDRYPLALAPFAFGEFDEGAGVHLTRKPDANGGDLLLAISNASRMLGSTEPDAEFAVHAYVGSMSATGIGSDTFPAAGEFSPPILLDDIDDGAATPPPIQTGEFAVFGNYFTGSPDFGFVPLGWRHDGEVAVEAPIDDGSYVSPLYFSAGTPVTLEAMVDDSEYALGNTSHLVIDSDLLSQHGEQGDETLFRETRTYDIPALSEDGVPLDHTAVQTFRVVRLECPHTVSATQSGSGGLMLGDRYIALDDGTILQHEEGSMPLVAVHLAISQFDEMGELAPQSMFGPPEFLSSYDVPEVAKGFVPESVLSEEAYLADTDTQDDVITLTPNAVLLEEGTWIVNAYFWSFVNQGSTTTEVHFVPTADCG